MESKIKTIIIEDEEPARNLLTLFVSEISELELIGEASDGFSAVKIVNELKPDLIILDIQMPKLTGFEMLELCEHKPTVIFSTAYDQYALKAFEINAVDYLLKPYDRTRFTKAIEKVIAKGLQKTSPQQEESLQTAIKKNSEILERIAVRMGQKIQVIPVDDILYLESYDDYVKIHTSKDLYLKEKTMKYFETNLDPHQFVRIHRSYVINLNFIERLDYYDKDSYSVILKNGNSLKASTSGYRLLKEKLNL